MISTRIGNEYKYDFTARKFQVAFDFLKRKDLLELPLGWIELEEGVRVSVQAYTSFKWEDNDFETHEKYFDVQYVIEGREMCGVCSRDGLVTTVPYNAENDIQFYEDPKNYGKVFLDAGDFIVLGPEDVHKPRCMADKQMPIKKIVIKVPV